MSGTGGDRRARWDARYARGEATHGFAPSPWLLEALVGTTPGRALDVACGAGRHALALAARGWDVVAVDGSAVGLDLMREEATRRGLGARLDARCADLEAEPPGFVPEPDGYELVADFYYLHRPLLPALRAAVRPGGLLVAAIHTHDPGRPDPHPFLLAPGELGGLVRGWGWEVVREDTVTDEDGHAHPTTRLMARRPR